MTRPQRDDESATGGMGMMRRAARTMRPTASVGDSRGSKVAKTMRTTTPQRKTSTLNMIRRLSERLISGEGGPTGARGVPDTGVPVSHISSPPMPADELDAVASTPRRARRLF
jgi:hypothetical protein